MNKCLLLLLIAVFNLIVCNTTCLAALRSYTVQSALSTITLETTCRVQVRERFIVKFEGDYGRMERAFCTKDMPNYASTFDVSDLKAISNYSTIHKTEIDVNFNCYIIQAFLDKRTPADQTTTVKFEFHYWIKGPFATMKNDEKREFELGWNMKFKKGLVESATFRVEYQKELYETNTSETSLLSNQFRRFERNFTNISPNDMMSINLKGHVISSLVETCPKSDNLFVVLCTIFFIVAMVVLGNSNRSAKPKDKDTTTNDTSSVTVNQQQYDYDSDGGCSGGSVGSCGCDFD